MLHGMGVINYGGHQKQHAGNSVVRPDVECRWKRHREPGQHMVECAPHESLGYWVCHEVQLCVVLRCGQCGEVIVNQVAG